MFEATRESPLASLAGLCLIQTSSGSKTVPLPPASLSCSSFLRITFVFSCAISRGSIIFICSLR